MRWWRRSSYAPLVSIIAVVLLLAALYAKYENGLLTFSNPAAQAEKTADEFLCALAGGDIPEAVLVGGQVAYKLAQARENELPRAEVTTVDTETVAASEKWARVRAIVELTLADGSPDIGWYELELINQDDWKIVNVRETVPMVAGRGRRVSDKDLAETRAVFERYLSLMAAGKYEQAAKECLAGPARRGQEAGASALGKATVIKDVRDLKATALYGRDKLAVVDCRYRADERPVRVLATFWRTTQGWRVVDLTGGN